MALEEVKNSLGAFDAPSIDDFKADHILGAEEAGLPAWVNMNMVPSHDQGSSWHCTAYALCHVHEILNTKEFAEKVKMDPEEQWANQCNRRGVPPTISGGDTLQNALLTLVKNGLNNGANPGIPLKKFEATGFALVDKDVLKFKRYLALGFPIYTGWNQHCFPLVGYDDGEQRFIAKNSYGEKWGARGDGTFDIPYKDIDKLFSGYIVYDKKDLKMIFQDVSEKSPMASAIQFVLDKNLMMGYGDASSPQERSFRPDQPMTRAEVATVLERFYNLLKSEK